MTAAARALPPPAQAQVTGADDALAIYRAVGEEFLGRAIGSTWWQRVPELHDAIAQTPIDEAWVSKRVAELEPMSDGPARLVARHIWNLARALMQPGAEWFDLWRELALRTPREWLVLFCGAAMYRADGSVRPLNHRAKSMLVAGVLAWQLAEYDPEGDPAFPYVIRGLPYGTWECLLSYWEHHADGYHLRRAKRSTVHGTHRAGGDPARGQCGYIATWKRVGIAYSLQPPYWAVEPRLRGKGRLKVVDGEEVWQCWAFHELRLRIPGGVRATAFGPPHQPWWTTRPRQPPPERGDMVDLTASIEAAERSWLGDEPPVRLVLPAAIVESPAGERLLIDAVQPEEPTAVADDLNLAGRVPAVDSAPARAEDALLQRCEAEGAVETSPSAEAVPVWLVPLAAAPTPVAPLEDQGTAQGTRPLVIVSPEFELPNQPDEPPTRYGAGKLIVMRADDSRPVSPRIRERLERFERAARWRERGPPE